MIKLTSIQYYILHHHTLLVAPVVVTIAQHLLLSQANIHKCSRPYLHIVRAPMHRVRSSYHCKSFLIICNRVFNNN